MDSRYEAAKLGPEKQFEKKINDIKTDHVKNINYLDIKISAITLLKPPEK